MPYILLTVAANLFIVLDRNIGAPQASQGKEGGHGQNRITKANYSSEMANEGKSQKGHERLGIREIMLFIKVNNIRGAAGVPSLVEPE